MIGPWLTGSSPGADGLNALPGLGVDRSEPSLTLPRQEVFAVEMRSWNWFVFPSHGAIAPACGPGALM
jgi:hypothetical protein